MAMSCGRGVGYVGRETLTEIVERNSNALPNVLVIGRDGPRRELVARKFHAASFHNKGVFTLLRCRKGSQGPKSEFLNLFFALTRDGHCPRSRKSELLSGGTLFIDEIEEMDLESQRICLEFLKQLQRLKSERPSEMGLRVVAGLSRDPSEATAQCGFLPSLLDLLDKVRVLLDAACEEKLDQDLPRGALITI